MSKTKKSIAKDGKKVVDTRDKFYAKIAFYLSLGFWIPLFNVGLCLISIIIASVALKNHFREPEKYGGFGLAITALILSIGSIILTIVGLIIFLMSNQICGTAVCQSYFANLPKP